VECECHGDGRGGEQVPGYLRLVFRGWSEDQVNDLVGEACKGWCTVESFTSAPAQMGEEMLNSLFHTSPTLQPLSLDDYLSPIEESTFILPTLDFSSSFHAQSEEVSVWNDVRDLDQWGTSSSMEFVSDDETFVWSGSDSDQHHSDTNTHWSYASC